MSHFPSMLINATKALLRAVHFIPPIQANQRRNALPRAVKKAIEQRPPYPGTKLLRRDEGDLRNTNAPKSLETSKCTEPGWAI
jgi:hypothetical protein